MSTNDHDETAPCGCKFGNLEGAGHRLGCLTDPDRHHATVTAREGAPGNWTTKCSCGQEVSLSGPPTLEAAQERATADAREHGPRLQREVDRERARRALAYVPDRREACRLLAEWAGWSDAPDPEAPGEVRRCSGDAWKRVGEHGGAPTHEHVNLAGSIAAGEEHAPAVEPRQHETTVTVTIPIRWAGEGKGPKAIDVQAELLRIPTWMHQLDDSDPEAWAVGDDVEAARADEALMVDLTRPAEGGPVRLEFGGWWEDGWYVTDHRGDVPAYFGPHPSAEVAVAATWPDHRDGDVQLQPGMAVQYLGAWPS